MRLAMNQFYLAMLLALSSAAGMTQTPNTVLVLPDSTATPSRPAPAVGHSATRSTVPPPSANGQGAAMAPASPAGVGFCAATETPQGGIVLAFGFFGFVFVFC